MKFPNAVTYLYTYSGYYPQAVYRKNIYSRKNICARIVEEIGEILGD